MSDRWRVLVTPRSLDITKYGLDRALADADCDYVRSSGPFSSAELAKTWADVDAVILGLDSADASALVAAPRLRVIARYGVGIDNVDLEEATRRGIIVTITANAVQGAVAELTMAFILCLVRGLGVDLSANVGQSNGRVPGRELAGRVVGVVGYGRIGREVARRALAFDCRVLIADPQLAKDVALPFEVRSLDQLLREADVVSLHVPLTPSTWHLIGRREFEMMRDGVFVVNTARGPLIDEHALSDALRTNHVAAAALDVREEWNPPATDPLQGLHNVIVTPHLGSKTAESIERMGRDAVSSVLTVKHGRWPPDVANPAVRNRLRFPLGGGVEKAH